MLDDSAIDRQFARAVLTYDSAAVLQQQIADELVERAELVNPAPETLLDLGTGTGYLGRRARERFPEASVVGVDRVAAMAVKASNVIPSPTIVIAAAEKLALAEESIPLVLSNLLLHWCDVGAVFVEVARVLEIGGTFLFSTLGPDTLLELRAAWAEVDDCPHVHTFIDMHDLGDALIAAGFSEPVLDIDRISMAHETVQQLVEELRHAGAASVRRDRRKTWTGKERYGRFVEACDMFREHGHLLSTWEVIYGLATKDRALIKSSIPVIALPGKN